MMKRSIFVLAALAGCVASIPACSSSDSGSSPDKSQVAGDKGMFDLNLVVNGEDVNVVTMTLTSTALPAPIVKDINTSKVTGAVKAFAGLLPVGDYSVSFAATTSGGKACTGSGGPFAVTAGGTAEVSVSVVCGGTAERPARGSANISATFAAAVQCPYLTEVIIAPTELEAGGVIDLSAKLSDTTGTFSWSASPATGTFGSASSPITTFTAAAAGSYTLTATLAKAGCTDDAIGTSVTFTPASGGGTGGTSGTGGATGTGGAVETGGTTSTGGAPETGGVTGTGGAGTGGAPTSRWCAPPTTEVPFATESCTTCEQNNCDPPVAPGCDSFATGSPEREQCDAVLRCVRTTNCQEAGGALNCFCGPGVDIVACKASLDNAVGACKAQIVAGYPTGSTAAFIVDNSTRVDIAGAAALSLAQCDFAFCGPVAVGGGNECVPYCQ